MSHIVRATPYTPVFPPALRIPGSSISPSTSPDSSVSVDEDRHRKKPYIDGLKERYILLASMPQGELCPPSRQPSPESENRIEGLRLRMRAARGRLFPHDPLLTLVCCGLRGGDWAGESRHEDTKLECHHVLPDTEEEWFRWEREKKIAHEQRRAEQRAAEHRQKIAKWSEGVEEQQPRKLGSEESVFSSQTKQLCEDGTGVVGFPANQSDPATTIEAQVAAPLFHSHRDDSEPVERMSSPMPLAGVLDPLPDFSDTFSIPDSPLLLPQLLPDIPLPDNVPQSPSFAAPMSTPHKRDSHLNPVFQLSSPVSPPRSLRPLTASQTASSLSAKRPCELAETTPDVPGDALEEPTTPRAIKKTRTMAEPITPASVPRQKCSQEQRDLKRLPTLTDLLASSRKTHPERHRLTKTPRRNAMAALDSSPSQPTYSMFRPQFESTQPRARSLPPSPSQIISPQKSFIGPASSFGMGLYQSQFNVERKVGEVTAFLNADVWDVES